MFIVRQGSAATRIIGMAGAVVACCGGTATHHAAAAGKNHNSILHTPSGTIADLELSQANIALLVIPRKHFRMRDGSGIHRVTALTITPWAGSIPTVMTATTHTIIATLGIMIGALIDTRVDVAAIECIGGMHQASRRRA